MNLDPKSISRFNKIKHLRSYSEADFRDKVIRPLFFRLGLLDGRDTCGPTEAGKDAVFIYIDPLGNRDVYALQTKIGNLTLASSVTSNIVTALTQVRTALESPVLLLNPRQSKRPTKVILATSGKINEAARVHIVKSARDAESGSIEFLDVDDLIPKIDEHLPQLWYAIDTRRLPYLERLLASLQPHAVATGEEFDPLSGPIQAESFVQLKATHATMQKIRRNGKDIAEPHFVEVPITSLLRIHDRMVLLLGEAGAGKSTSLRRLVVALVEQVLAKKESQLPVLVRAIDINANRNDLLGFLAALTDQCVG